MFKTERMDAILGILQQKKHVSVHYLAEHVFASEVTIRRDLHKMEELGLIVRSYGGVTLRVTENVSVPLVIREQNLSAVKNRIAEEAVRLIRDGDTVFMDGSSTVLCMVNFLRERQNMTVITNSLRVATQLCEKRIPVYCTGGLLVPEALVCVGNYSNSMLESVTADCMFFSSQGFSAEGKVCDFSENETYLRRLMLQHAHRKYFLCDSSKLGKSFLFTVCQMSDLDRIVCDVNVAEWLQKQEKKTLYNEAEVARVGNVSERGTGYTIPSGTTIPKGNYTIGEEIPAGTYKIYFTGTTTSRVHVFQDSKEASNTFNKGKETILDWNNTERTVTLSEGNILRVEYTPIIMTKGGGFSFD